MKSQPFPEPGNFGACPHCPVHIASAGKPWERTVSLCNGTCLRLREAAKHMQDV